MHILIISGQGDIRQYIWDKGIGLHFYKCTDLDRLHWKQYDDELDLLYKDAYIHLKGLCFVTQRYETIEAIHNKFKNQGHKIEYLRLEKDGKVFTFNEEDLGIALEEQWEIR